MFRPIFIAIAAVLSIQPDSLFAQPDGRQKDAAPTNRLIRSHFDAIQPIHAAIGTPQAPDFFFANATHCPDIVPRRSTMDIAFQRVCPNGRAYPVTERQFLNSVMPGVPICVMVHGSFVPSTEFRGFFDTYRWLRSGAPHLPLHVVFYRWPSSANVNPLTAQVRVEQLGQRAEAHGFRLALFLKRLPSENPVGIFAHSHGTRCASSALHLLGGGRVGPLSLNQKDTQKRFRVVFSAAAIDHHWLNPNQRFGRAFDSAESILNLRSRRDWALGLYPLRNQRSEPALGVTGLTPIDRFALGDSARKYTEIDVTPIVGTGHGERSYVRHVAIARSFMPWMCFADRPPLASVRGHSSRETNRRN